MRQIGIVTRLALVTWLAGAAAPYSPPSAHEMRLMARLAKIKKEWAINHTGTTPDRSQNPVISSANVTTPKVNGKVPPGAPAISFNFTTGSSGLNYVVFGFVGPNNQELIVGYTAYTAPTSGTYIVQQPGSIGQYAATGNYKPSYADIVDNDGNYTSYTPNQLKSIYQLSTIKIVNSTPDTTAPTITSGNIQTPTVSLSSPSPTFVANLNVNDTISGVHYAYMTIEDPNDAEYYAYGSASQPIVGSGALQVGLEFAGHSPSQGTYTIADIVIYDYAGNISTVSGPSAVQALIGTSTFQVTQ